MIWGLWCLVKKPEMRSQSLQFNKQIVKDDVESWMEYCQISYFCGEHVLRLC